MFLFSHINIAFQISEARCVGWWKEFKWGEVSRFVIILTPPDCITWIIPEYQQQLIRPQESLNEKEKQVGIITNAECDPLTKTIGCYSGFGLFCSTIHDFCQENLTVRSRLGRLSHDTTIFADRNISPSGTVTFQLSLHSHCFLYCFITTAIIVRWLHMKNKYCTTNTYLI